MLRFSEASLRGLAGLAIAILVSGCFFQFMPPDPINLDPPKVRARVYIVKPHAGGDVSWQGRYLSGGTLGDPNLESASSEAPLPILLNQPHSKNFPVVEDLRNGLWEFTFTITSPIGTVEIVCERQLYFGFNHMNVVIGVEDNNNPDCSGTGFLGGGVPGELDTHDVAIVDMDVTPFHLIDGLVATVCVTAVNRGDVADDLRVTIEAPGVVSPAFDRFPSAPPNGNTLHTFSFKWNTTGVGTLPQFNKRVSAIVTPVPYETKLFDNSHTQPITVRPVNQLGYWPMNQVVDLGPAVAPDSSGNGHDGAVNGPIWVAGIAGNGLNFDGVDDFVAIADSDELDLLSGNFTIAAWINPRTRGQQAGRILDHGGGGGGITVNAGWAFRLESAENRLGLFINGTELAISDIVITPGDNEWEHVAVTRNVEGDIAFYRNGVPVGRTENTGVPTVPLPQADEIRVGNRVGGTVRTFDGLIDDVRIYGSPLNVNEIESVYVASRGVLCQ